MLGIFHLLSGFLDWHSQMTMPSMMKNPATEPMTMPTIATVESPSAGGGVVVTASVSVFAAVVVAAAWLEAVGTMAARTSTLRIIPAAAAAAEARCCM
jgi:hypothetical protein